jgi:hypothetical protein
LIKTLGLQRRIASFVHTSLTTLLDHLGQFLRSSTSLLRLRTTIYPCLFLSTVCPHRVGTWSFKARTCLLFIRMHRIVGHPVTVELSCHGPRICAAFDMAKVYLLVCYLFFCFPISRSRGACVLGKSCCPACSKSWWRRDHEARALGAAGRKV